MCMVPNPVDLLIYPYQTRGGAILPPQETTCGIPSEESRDIAEAASSFPSFFEPFPLDKKVKEISLPTVSSQDPDTETKAPDQSL